MSRCRCCNTEIHGSEGRVYCVEGKCKDIFITIKNRVREQNKKYWSIMDMKCKTCKKKLTEGEDKYCSVCVNRMNNEKKRRAETDYFRPCQDCGEDMKNPAPNRKSCIKCGKKKQRIAIDARDARLKKERDARRANNPNRRQRAGDKTDVHTGTIDPKWLQPMGSKRKVG